MMFVYVRLALLIVLICISVCTANLVIQEKPIDNNSGWRCGERIVTPEIFYSATDDALIHVADNVGLKPEEIDYPYPEPYEGYFGFNGENGHNLLWPILNTESPPGSYEKIAHDTFVVLRSHLENKLEPIGAVEKLFNNEYRKCVWERDLSDMMGSLTVAGFRCPSEIFPIEIAERSVISAIDHIKRKIYQTKVFPAHFGNGNKLFDISGPLFIWPISTSGTFNSRVLTSIVIDNGMNLIGMVHRRENKFLRCTATPFLHRQPKFLHTNILPRLGSQGSIEEDVFKCGVGLIPSNMALLSAIEAVPGLALKSHDRGRKFPRFLSSSDDENNPANFYLWPVILEGTTVYKSPGNKPDSKYFKPSNGIFLVINDFSDVAGIVKETSKHTYKICERYAISLNTDSYHISEHVIGQKRRREEK